MAVAAAVVVIIVIVVIIIVVVVMVLFVIVVVLVLVIIVVVMVDEMSVLVDHRCEVVVVAFAVGVVAFALSVLVVMVVMTLAVRIVTFFLVVVVVMVAFAVRIVAFAFSVLVIVVMVVFQRLFVNEIIDSGIVDGVEHLVGELMLVDIKDSAHEVEVDLVGAGDGTVVFDTVVHVDKVEGDAFALVVDDGGLDVSEETSALALNEFTYGDECGVEFGLCVGVEVVELSAETCCAASRLLDGVLFVSAHCISSYAFSRLVPSLTETGITGLSGKR